VAQCDGTDPKTLAYAVLRSILEVGRNDDRPRSVRLVSSHPTMQRIFENFGFRLKSQQKFFAIGGLRPDVDLPSNTANWLVNLDWGARVLRGPFINRADLSSPDAMPEVSDW
jgi:hypothetical protein